MNKKYYKELISELKEKKHSKEQIAKLKRKLAKKYKLSKFPTDIEIFLNADASDVKYLKQLQTKPTRSLSGVAVVAVMTKPFKCPHGKCAICPGGPDSVFGSVPQSYTGKEPATMRAIRAGFDAYFQVFNRLEQYIVSGHVPDKVELIIMGGTFPSFPKKYQEEFVKYCFKAMNDFSKMFFVKDKLDIIRFKEFFELPGKVGSRKRTMSIQRKLKRMKNSEIPAKMSIKMGAVAGDGACRACRGKSDNPRRACESGLSLGGALRKTNVVLSHEQKLNEKSKTRCIGLTIETRPDYAKLSHAKQMLKLGCTRVELGVQSIYENLLRNIERGHTVKDSVKATEILKDLGFKINYHFMLGLPGSDGLMDLYGLVELFNNPNFKPDMLKIYPCMVVKGTKLYNIWKKKKFVPLSTKKAAEIIIEFKKVVPEYARIMRVQRDIPTYMTEAGVDRTNLRQLIQEEMKRKKIICNCIRCREIGRAEKVSGKIRTKILMYNASKGIEFFISENKGNALLGFCRMRFPCKNLRKEITRDSALIRELHVYGETAALGETEEGRAGKIQHRGIGRKLLKKAGQLAKLHSMKKMVVISGVGVRDYYRKLGYRLEGVYMVKKL